MISELTWHEWPLEKPEKPTFDIGDEYLVELNWPYSRIACMDYAEGKWWFRYPSTEWTNQVLRWAAMPTLDTASNMT